MSLILANYMIKCDQEDQVKVIIDWTLDSMFGIDLETALAKIVKNE